MALSKDHEKAIADGIETMELIGGNFDAPEMKQIGAALITYCDEPGFIIPFDKVVEWLEFSSKGHAKRALIKNFKEGVDFRISTSGEGESVNIYVTSRHKHGGHNKECIMLTCSTLRRFVMVSQTARSKAFLTFLNKVWLHSNQLYSDCITVSKFKKKRKRNNESFLDEFEEEKRVRDSEVSMHDAIKKRIAVELDGEEEVINSFGVADVESEDYVIEVKPTSEFKHGLGQIICYATATGKRGRLHVFGADPTEDMYRICKAHNVSLVVEQVTFDTQSTD